MFQNLSPNMLKTFIACPKKFAFKYIKNINMPVNDEIFETGKNIHALASYYLRNENIDKLEQALNPHEKEIWEYLKRIVYFSYETIKTEYNLSVKLGDCFFGGRLDALVKNGDKYFILDYKTGSIPKNAIYDYQTMIYILSVSEFFKTDSIAFVYIDLRNKSELKIEFTQELKNEYKNRLLKISNEILKEETDATFSKKNCTGFCEYDMICY